MVETMIGPDTQLEVTNDPEALDRLRIEARVKREEFLNIAPRCKELGEAIIQHNAILNQGRLSDEDFERWQTRYRELREQLDSAVEEFAQAHDAANAAHERYLQTERL